MSSNLSKPCIQEAKISVCKGMTFSKRFRITNSIGRPFDLTDQNLRGYYTKDDKCFCPEIEFCVNLVDNCSTIEMVLDARDTEKLKPCRSYFFYIDLNPRPKLDEIDRELKIMEVENYVVVPDMTIEEYTNYRYIEPELDHPASVRLVKGIMKVD